jgi:hypothetical protein
MAGVPGPKETMAMAIADVNPPVGSIELLSLLSGNGFRPDWKC